jgi:hypothetical protein
MSVNAPEREIWFARRYPIGDMRPGLAPVHWKGWALIAAFFVALIVDAALGFWLASTEQAARGILFCLILAFGAVLGFVRVRHIKGDHIRCAADYRKDNARA